MCLPVPESVKLVTLKVSCPIDPADCVPSDFDQTFANPCTMLVVTAPPSDVATALVPTVWTPVTARVESRVTAPSTFKVPFTVEFAPLRVKAVVISTLRANLAPPANSNLVY